MSAKSSYYNFRACKAYERQPRCARSLKTRRFFKKSGHRHDRRAVAEMLREELENLASEQLTWWEQAGFTYDPDRYMLGMDFSDEPDQTVYATYAIFEEVTYEDDLIMDDFFPEDRYW